MRSITNGQEFADRYLTNVHDPSVCAWRPCVIHNPSDHVMSEFPLHWRADRAIFERLCPHGIGHPDPDQRDFLGWGGKVVHVHKEGAIPLDVLDSIDDAFRKSDG